MRRTSFRGAFAVLALCLLASGAAFANSGFLVPFPSNTTFFCSQGASYCDFMGNNGGLSAPLWTAGDFITETFFNPVPFVSDLEANWGVVDDFGGLPGAVYQNDVYINGVWVGYFYLEDCDYCKTLYTVTGTADFAPIYGSGSYNLSIVLHQTTPGGLGSEWFSVLNASGGASTAFFSTTPEPSSILLLGSGLIGIAGVVRRKLMM